MKTIKTLTTIMWFITSALAAFRAGIGAANAIREAIRAAAEDEDTVEKVRDKLKAAKDEAN